MPGLEGEIGGLLEARPGEGLVVTDGERVEGREGEAGEDDGDGATLPGEPFKLRLLNICSSIYLYRLGSVYFEFVTYRFYPGKLNALWCT